jgi:hypothetical protein
MSDLESLLSNAVSLDARRPSVWSLGHVMPTCFSSAESILFAAILWAKKKASLTDCVSLPACAMCVCAFEQNGDIEVHRKVISLIQVRGCTCIMTLAFMHAVWCETWEWKRGAQSYMRMFEQAWGEGFKHRRSDLPVFFETYASLRSQGTHSML